MDETQLAARLKDSIPADSVYQAPIPAEPEQNTNNGQATIAPSYALDEITQYKLHDLFGAQYDTKDEVARQQLNYIYEQVAGMLPEKEYGFVAAKIVDLQRIIGIASSDDRIYRLYQWLKLNNVRRNLDAEMESLQG